MDVTKHTNVEAHLGGKGLIVNHAPAWYANFNNVCPVCNAPAEFKEHKDGGDSRTKSRTNKG